jgi:hypothetical protein
MIHERPKPLLNIVENVEFMKRKRRRMRER